MRKLIFTLIMLCAMSASAQKLLDEDGVLWSTVPNLQPKAVGVDYRGLQFDLDSVDVYVNFWGGFMRLDIYNRRSSEIFIMWDETTMNGTPIVFDDMRVYQIGSPIKPNVIDAGGYLSKKITSETYAKSAAPIVGKFFKDEAKKNKFTTIYITMSIAIRQNEKTRRHQFYLQGLWDGKKVKNYKELNDKQDFTELENKYKELGYGE